ncbi:8730_t:CDS:2 [Cetraspora pellucida]|uniref:8730_t:CDS:1 n=1 Tax=Cetraspora pellucida TaxID=1433469 RepID=A0A9N9IK77_9GLOM|nr:8730_t:CDS:2 [Cetraspora pellucida]
MNNEQQISNFSELLEYLHEKNTNKNGHIILTSQVTNKLFELLNDMSLEIGSLKAQQQDLVEFESIPKPTGLKYINLAEVLGLEHNVSDIRDLVKRKLDIQKTWKDQDINSIAHQINSKNNLENINFFDNDNYVDENDIEENYNIKNSNTEDSNTEENDNIERNENSDIEENNIFEENDNFEDNISEINETNNIFEENISSDDNIAKQYENQNLQFTNKRTSNKELLQDNQLLRKSYLSKNINSNKKILQDNELFKRNYLRTNTNSNKELLQVSKKHSQDNEMRKRKYSNDNTDFNKEHSQVNKPSKKKYHHKDTNLLNDDYLQNDKTSKKRNSYKNTNNNNTLHSSIIENAQDSNYLQASTTFKKNMINKTHNLRSHTEKIIKIK